MTGAAHPARGLADLLTGVFWRRPKLLTALLLLPPLLWLGVVYVGSLIALLVQSFYSIDQFTGLVVPEFTLKTYGELLIPSNFDVILRTVFGVDDARELDVYRTVVIEAIESAAPVLFFFPALRREFGGVGPYARLVARQRRFVDLLKGQIERVRPQASERADILSMMLEARYEDGEPMSDESLVDELRTLLLAGHETTAITLAWALYLVHRHPAVYHRLREELDGLGESPTPEAIAHLPYLDAVVNESLRLHPVVQEVMRTLTKPFELGAYTLPPGVTIAVNIFLAHRRTELFPEPEEFRPERFLDRTFSPFEYMPFGGGPRRCLGAAFALYEMKLVLATLLGDLELDLASEGPVEPVRRNLTMAPRGGVPLRVVRRRRPA